MFIIVYKTINLLNNKEYIGVHSLNSLNDNYLGSGLLIKQAVKKYGKTNFKRIILKIFNNKESAYEYERFLVDEKYVSDKMTYNLKIGGKGSKFHTDEMKKKLSDKLGHKVVLIKGLDIFKFNSIIKASKFLNVSKQSIYPILNKKTNNQTIKGYNVCYLKDYDSNITFKKINRGKPKVKVKQLSLDGEILNTYESLTEASLNNNIPITRISACVNNRIKTAGGFKWIKL